MPTDDDGEPVSASPRARLSQHSSGLHGAVCATPTLSNFLKHELTQPHFKIYFECFIVTWISEAARNSGAGIGAFANEACFVADSTDDETFQDYPDVVDIQYDEQQPNFEIGCLTLTADA